MPKVFLLLCLIILWFSAFAQQPSVLLRVEENHPLIVYADSSFQHIITIVTYNEDLVPPICVVRREGSFFYYGTVYVEDVEEEIAYEGYVGKLYCFGILYPDYYSKNGDGLLSSYIHLYSRPSKDSSYLLLPLDNKEIKAIPLSFVNKDNTQFANVLFMYNHKLMLGFVTRLCTQVYTTCN